MSIADDLDKAEENLARALSKMLPYAGSAAELPSGKRWIGSWTEVRKTSSALLKVRSLAKRMRQLETPRQRKPGVFAARPGSVSHDLQATEIYHGVNDHDQ